jgi:hypothetical protein
MSGTAPLAPLEAFARSWAVEILKTAPLIAPARQFMFPQDVPGEEDALQRGALRLQVRPAGAPPFLATCALGFRDPSLPSGAWACPAADDLLAVAGGYAYRIPTQSPGSAELLEQRPVVAVLPVQEPALLLLAGFHDVLALGASGVLWRTGRLSWEGLTLGHVQEGLLHGTGWDMFADRDVPFTVDLRDGTHKGGGYTVR